MAIPDKSNVRQHILDTARQIIGRKGFSAVGLNELLQAAGVPKGSFYHYFGSKDAFGQALLEDYFDRYVAQMQQDFLSPAPERETLLAYWQGWKHSQSDCSDAGKCLAVKLGAEVADLSEPMRLALQQGTTRIIGCLTTVLERGQAHGSLQLCEAPGSVAAQLYALWLGASVMAKITRTALPFDQALTLTGQVLGSADFV